MATAVAGPDVELRPLRHNELEGLAAQIPETTASQMLNRWREQGLGYRELLAAVKDGEVVGTVSIAESERPPRSLHLFAFEVAQHLRRRGIGGAVLNEVMNEARRRGRKQVFLEVRTDNPARRLYHRAGFRRVGEPFTNSWWRYLEDGTQERVQEPSYRMVKRVR